MKLSEQYKHHIQKLNEAKSGEKIGGDKKVVTGWDKPYSSNTDDTIWRAGNAYDPFNWLSYTNMGIGVLTLIFGRSAILKLFGKKVAGGNTAGAGTTRYNVFKRIKDKKAMKAVFKTDSEMRDVWMKFQKQIQQADEDYIKRVLDDVEKGHLSAKQAMIGLGHITPRGAKSAQYAKLRTLETAAASKSGKITAAAEASKKEAAAAAIAKAQKKAEKEAAAARKAAASTNPYYGYTSTSNISIKPKPTGTVAPLTGPLNPTTTVAPLTGPLNPATTAVRGAVSNGVNYPNITQKQFDQLNILDKYAILSQPNLTYNQLTTGNY